MLQTGKDAEQEVVQVHTRKSSRLFTFFNSQKVVPYVLISPFILSFIVLSFYPTVQAIVMSFQRVLPSEVTFVGLWNYSRIFNPTFFTALQNTTTYMILTVVILVSIPMLFAVLLNSKVVKFRILFRTALFLPALTSVIVAGMVFRLMFSESDTAVANQILNWIGLESVEWRYNAWSGMFLMVVLASWRWMGINILYFLAALQNVPKELYEAADIDGANVVQKFFYVTLPFLKPVTIFVTTISVIGGFRMFEESFVFWEAGSPGNIGLTIVGYLYQEGIQQNDMGFGAAIGVVLMLIIFVISITQLYLTGAFKKGDQ